MSMIRGMSTTGSRPLEDHERWLEQFHSDAEHLANEDLGTEPDAW